MRRIDRRKELREMDHQDHGFYSGNGISRYHSAPGSLLSNLTTKEGSSNSGQSNGTLPAIYCTGMPPVAAAAWRGGLDLTSSMSGHSQGHSHGESGVFTGSRNKQENSEQESGGDSQGRGRCFTFMETLRGNTSPRKGEFVGQQPAAPRGGSPAGLLQKLQIQGQAQEQRPAGGILSRSRSENMRNLHRDLGSSSIDPALWESQDASSYLPDDRSKRLLDLGIDQFGDISFQEDSGLEHPAIALTRHLGFATAGRSPESISALHDSVPCRFRAKRGCATHPRSIAERNRRTRISERMRKLQELVPNMDKQTNTADMLDETIDYVKLLQRQVQELSDCELKCRGLCKKQRPGEDEKQNSK